MQELLAQIYAEVRDEKAHEVYGKSLRELTADERSQINWMVPMSIFEGRRRTDTARERRGRTSYGVVGAFDTVHDGYDIALCNR